MTRVGDADPVEHPAHYELSHPGLECIDLTAGMSFCMGNAVKYVWRYRSKNKLVEDLKRLSGIRIMRKTGTSLSL